MNDHREKDINSIPGLNDSALEYLRKLGNRKVYDLKDKDPEELYGRLCRLCKQDVDRVMLYILRYAVYYASNDQHDPELMSWWKWKDDLTR